MSASIPRNPTPRRVKRRRLAKPILALAMFFVALESVLQVGAFAMTLGPDVGPGSASPLDPDKPTVLCIGDSFTFGVGATSSHRSYPRQLERRLHARGLDVRVEIGAQPGRNSREALLRVAAKIPPRTKVICALLGANDIWSRPEELTPDSLNQLAIEPTSDGFEWKWRTGRLLALLFRFSFGSWHASGTPDAAEGTPGAAIDTTIDHATQAAGFGLLISHGREFGWLGETAETPVTRPGDPALREPARQFATLLLANHDEEALALAKETLERHPNSIEFLARLVRVQARLGHAPDAALGRLAELADDKDDKNAPATTDWYIWALGHARRDTEALAVASARVEAEPASITAWSVITRVAFDAGDQPAFRRAVARTLTLLGTKSPNRTAWLVRDLVSVTTDYTGPQVARLLVAAYLLDGDDIGAGMSMSRAILRGKVSHADYQGVLNHPLLPKSARNRLAAALAELEVLDQPAKQWQRTLQAHLTTLGSIAKTAGAELILVSYPGHMDVIETAQSAAAASLGARYVLVREAFDEALQTKARSELFVSDGHCSDAGYGLMADRLVDAVAEALQR